MSIGYIHSIETCGAVDGPGLRYVAFFQGCALRCKYCHNPDTWKFNTGTKMTVDELLQDALKYKSYMKFSRGGFTASGGEPLLQAEFIGELFRKLQQHGIHTALDTSGSAPVNEALLSYTSLVLLDIKSIHPNRYLQVTGAELNPTLEFARYLDKQKIPVWIRYVVVPKLTDAPEDIERLSEYLSTLTNIQRLELLPFHKIGEYKWETLNLLYTLKDTPVPDERMMEKLRDIVRERGLPI